MHINKEFDIDILIQSFKKTWYWMLLLLFLVIGGAFVYLRYTKPIYESSAVIQIVEKDEGQKIVDIENINTENSKLQEELELLKSELLFTKTLNNLDYSVSYFSKGKILTEEKYTNSSFQIQTLEVLDSTIKGTSISLQKGDNYKIQYNFKGENFQFELQDDSLIQSPHFKAYFRIVDSARLNEDVSENELYFKFNNFNSLTPGMLGSLNVTIVNPEAKTLQVLYKSNNSVLARDVVRTHIQTFFKFDEEAKNKTSSDILTFIKEQLDSVRNELIWSEDSLKKFKEDNRENLAHQPSMEIYTKINELQSKLVEYQLDEQILVEIERAIRVNQSRVELYKLIAATVGTQFESSLGKQLNDLHELMLEKETLLFERTPNNSKVKIVSQEIAAQKESILNIIAALNLKLSKSKSVLLDEKSKLEKNFIQMPEKEMGLTRLKRMYSLNEKYYMLLLEKKTQYSISDKGFHSTNLILKEPIVSYAPVSPNRKLIYIGAFLLGLVLGLLVLIFKYLLFNEVQSMEELKKVLDPRISHLGMVPKYKKNIPNSQIVVHLSPKSIISENFRNIRTNLQFLKVDGKGTMAISSSISGEGKTFVALNLAGIIALSGKKTILVDLDLRKPKVHLGFDVKNDKGMSTVLSGRDNLTDCIRNSEIKGLDFITAGPIPPNPSELIINKRIEEIIKELEGEYDQVIIDNPPIGLISDGLHIFNLVDIPIYIFRANYSKRNFSSRLNELVDEGKIKNLAIILNGFTSTRKGYGYGYGYGYGNYYEE